MARMFPDQFPKLLLDDPKRSAEIRVYNQIRDVLKPDRKWHCFYSVGWVERQADRPAAEGEADFVIAHPQKGLLLLEVKGGRISHDGKTQRWCSTDRNGNKYAIDPVKQLNKSRHALISKFRASPDWARRWVDCGHAVVFPDCQSNKNLCTTDLPSEIIIFGDEFDILSEKIDAIFEYWTGRKLSISVDEEIITKLITVLAPTFEMPDYRLNLMLTEAQQKILQLTEEQFNILECLSRNPHVAISGGAGTGKTYLAIEKARRVAQQGQRVLLLCYNRPLAEFLKTCLLNNAPSVMACTFHQLCYNLATQVGIQLADPDARSMPERFYETDMPGALMEALDRNPQLGFDTIIIDEGQDFYAEWLTILLEMGLRRTNGCAADFYIFYDNNQKVYRQGMSLKLPTKDFVNFRLNHNLRNTAQIFKLAQKYYTGDSYYSSRTDGPPIGKIIADNPDAIKAALKTLLSRLTKQEKIKANDIAMLSGKALETCSLAKTNTLGDVRLSNTTNSNAVLVQTIHRFKGLERSVVILFDLDGIETNNELLYVGITRAQTYLILVGPLQILNKIG